MSKFTVTGPAWSSVTLAQDEIWQVRSGLVEVESADPAAPGAEPCGVVLGAGQALSMTGGNTVYLRSVTGAPAASESSIVARVVL